MPASLRRIGWAAVWASAAVLLAALSIRAFLLYMDRPDLDHGIHVAYARRLVADGTLLPHFAYHALVALASGMSSDPGRLTFAAVVVLAALVLAKLALSLGLLRELCLRCNVRLSHPAALALFLAFAFVAPLPKWWAVDNIYLGQLSPTVWHNPTAITALPLAVAVFWAFVRRDSAASVASFLRFGLNSGGCAAPPSPSRTDDLRVGLLLALSVMAKPNFALAFVPAAALLQLLRRRLDLPGSGLRYLPAAAVLAWQYLHVLGSGLEPHGGGVLRVAPLAVWRLYSPHPLVSALVSLAFPVAVLLFARRDARHGSTLLAAWLLTGVAVAEFALLAEPEPRLGDANYYWGIVPAVYLLFLASVAELLAPRALTRGRRVVRGLCWTLLALHVASGVWLYAWPFQLAVAD